MTSANGFALDLQQLTYMTRKLARDAREGDLAPVLSPDLKSVVLDDNVVNDPHRLVLNLLGDAQDALDTALKVFESLGAYRVASYRMELPSYKPSPEVVAAAAKRSTRPAASTKRKASRRKTPAAAA